MKKVFFLFSVLILALSINTIKAQDVSVDLVVFEPLPEIDLGALFLGKNLKGAPLLLQITFNPLPESKIILIGTVEWKKSSSDSYQNLYNFTTNSFVARTLSNKDIGTDIGGAHEESNRDLLEEFIKRGKPTGSIRITIEIKNEFGKFLGNDSEELNFINPAQTLSIRTPEAGTSQDIGGVLAEWDDVQGVGNYSIRANVRSNINQSFEEALKSGNPIINDKNVGNVTNVNLRELLDREWLPGQEVVFQVTANISGPGGGTKLYSNIVNFSFDLGGSSGNQELNDGLINLFQGLGDEGTKILSLLVNGEINLEDVTITFGDGQVMTLPEFQNLMIYLETNPDAVISIKYNQN